MGLEKAKKSADPVTDWEVSEQQVHEYESKTKKTKRKLVKPTTEFHAQLVPAEEPEKPLKTKTKKSEIDDIFGQKKRKKAEGELDANATQAAAKKKDKGISEVVKLNSRGELVRPRMPQVAKPTKSTAAATVALPTPRKKTEDGFTVYSAEELGFNKKNAGGTKLCPFDCDCCF